MQTGKVSRQEISNSKLLGIITTALIAVLAIPVIIPHITHTDLIYHILVHIASVIIAVFLSANSNSRYRALTHYSVSNANLVWHRSLEGEQMIMSITARSMNELEDPKDV